MFKTPEFKVGLTVLTAAALLIAGILWGTRSSVGGEKSTFLVTFNMTYGLDPEDPVTISGVRQGRVASLELKDDHVLVRLEIDGKVDLPNDSRIYIKNVGLMGEKFVAIEKGTAKEMLDPAIPVQGTRESGITEVFGGLGGILAKTEKTLDGLDRILGSEELEQSLKQSIREIRTMVSTLSRVVRENKGDLEGVLADFKVSSRAMKNIVGSREEELKGAVDNFVTSSAQLSTTLANLEELSGSFKAITARIENNEGSLGRMINNKELYEKMLHSIGQIDSLVADVKRNPRKYTKGIKFEVF